MMLFTLSDIDECTSVDHPHNCDSNANCTDTEGDFECACNNGWTGNGTHCEGRSQSILTVLFSRRASRGWRILPLLSVLELAIHPENAF